jgi:sulfide:quinone oxidoreductase
MGSEHYRVLIIGGGTGGIATASLLRRAGVERIAVVEPSKDHFYQPLWTLVSAGVVRPQATRRPESNYIPRGVRWVRDTVAELSPETRRVQLLSGAKLSYDFLVLAPGVRPELDAITGLREALATPHVSTNYSYELAPKTWELIRNFRGGVALFHMPSTPIKCPGAPQKIMYLAADYWRRHRLLAASQVIYGSGTAAIYGIKPYAMVLEQVLARYGIDARFKHELVEIRPEQREAVFERANGDGCERVSITYDMLHVVAPQRPPRFVTDGPLADERGWVSVDQYTLSHPRFAEVFALGDAAGTPNSKTGASAAKQARVVAANLVSRLNGEEPSARYDGYVACPIVTGYGRMVLCEFDYSGNATPTLPWLDTFRERYDMWLLKRYGLPLIYWNFLLRGRAIPFVARETVPSVSHTRLQRAPAHP